jgi:hypothetical protein
MHAGEKSPAGPARWLCAQAAGFTGGFLPPGLGAPTVKFAGAL